MIVRELLTKIGFNVDDKALDRVEKNINHLSNNLQKMSDRAASMGKSLTAFATLPILGLGAALIKSASDAEETFSKYETVFSNIQQTADETATNLARNFGLSSIAARKLLGDTGDLLTGFGFSQDAALDLSKQVNELAVDLASFTNYSGGAEGASAALTKALLGEREAIKSLGISVLEEDVKNQVLLMQKQGLTFETERQAKAYATLQIMIRQSKNAIGDFARNQHQFANQTRIFAARLQDLTVMFGNILLPIATKLVGHIIKLMESFMGLDESVRRVIIIVGGLVAAIGPVLLLFSLLIRTVLFMGPAFRLIAGAISLVIAAFKSLSFVIAILRSISIAIIAMKASLLLIPIAVMAVVYTLATLWNAIWKWISSSEEMMHMLRYMWETVLWYISYAVDYITAGAQKIINAFAKAATYITNLFETIKNGIAYFIDQSIQNVQEFIDTYIQGLRMIKDFITGILSPVLDPLIGGIKTIVGALGSAKNLAGKAMNSIGEALNFNENLVPVLNGDIQTSMRPLDAPFERNMVQQQALSTMNQNRNVQVNSDITVNVPPGTSDMQAEFIRQAAKESFAEEYNRQLQSVFYDNPHRE